MRRAAVLATLVLALAFTTSACSSKSEPDPAVASLESRVATTEDHLAGVEAVVGQALIAQPAAQLQTDIDALTKDIANAQVPADVKADADAAKASVAAAQKAAQDFAAAEAAKDAAAADALAQAQAAVAAAREKLDALKQRLNDFLATASPRPSPTVS